MVVRCSRWCEFLVDLHVWLVSLRISNCFPKNRLFTQVLRLVIHLLPVGGVVRALTLLSVHMAYVVRVLLLELIQPHDFGELGLKKVQTLY